MQSSRLLTQLVRRQMVRSVSYDQGHGHALTGSTYNDLPSPQGSWQTQHDANQRKYNAHLILGIGFMALTIGFGKAMGFLEFYDSVPEVPAKIDSYK